MTQELKPSPVQPIVEAMANAVDKNPGAAAISLWEVYSNLWPCTVAMSAVLSAQDDYGISLVFHPEGDEFGYYGMSLRYFQGRVFSNEIAGKELRRCRLVGSLALPAVFLVFGGARYRPTVADVGGAEIVIVKKDLALAAITGTLPFRPYGGVPKAVKEEQRRLRRDG